MILDYVNIHNMNEDAMDCNGDIIGYINNT